MTPKYVFRGLLALAAVLLVLAVATGVSAQGRANTTTGIIYLRSMMSNLLFSPDNTYDIGANGATRPKNLWLAGSIVAAANGQFSGSVITSQYQLTSLLVSNAVPTISSGFGTSPSVLSNNGTATFRVNVGTGGVATSGVVAMNATANTGWNCQVTDMGPGAIDATRQTASTTTTVTVGAATAWAASDILIFTCGGS